MNYPLQIVVGILVVLLLGFCIDNRKPLKRKIQKESISFAAMLFSVSMALISFTSKPNSIPSGTLALIEGETISLVFPITAFLIVLAITTTIYFFRKELKAKL